LQTVPTAQDSRVYPSHNVPRMPASPLVPRSRQTLPARLPRNSYLDRPVFAAEPSPLAREVTFDFPSPGPARRPLPFHQGQLETVLSVCMTLLMGMGVQVCFRRGHRAAVMCSLWERIVHQQIPTAAVLYHEVLCLRLTG
jgi:hypothetical protein